MEQAIKRAIEGGYAKDEFYFMEEFLAGDIPQKIASVNKMLLDPLFWQALGKAEGWGEFKGRGEGPYSVWKWQWHRFIDHLAEGGTPDEFFNRLLKK